MFTPSVKVLFGYRVLGFSTLLLTLLFGIQIGTVHADPHAMFYTTIGQQQLFFNVLAALDQADYVEPASGTHSRKELEDQRTAAGLLPELKQTITATQTKLSSLLTRPITLEGNDLWTAFLENSFALQAKGSRDLDQIIRLYCTVINGNEDCSHDGEKKPELAFNNRPIETAKEPGRAGTAALFSDTSPDSYYQTMTRDIITGKQPPRSVPFRPDIAALRANNRDNPVLASAVNSAAQRIASMFNETVDPTLYDSGTVDSGGRFSLKPQISTQGNTALAASHPRRNPIDIFTQTAVGLNDNGRVLLSAYNAAAAAKATEQAVTKAGGLTATEEIYPKASAQDCSSGTCQRRPARNATTHGVETEVVTPAQHKGAAAQSAYTAIATEAGDPEYVPATGETDTSGVDLTDPATGNTPPPGQPNAPVAGARTTALDNSSNPRVASAIDLPPRQFPTLNASKPIGPAAAEEGTGHLLQQLLAGNFPVRGQKSTCACSLAGTLNDFSGPVQKQLAQTK